MNDDTLKLVIVGHVDHGKSTLIGRLFFDTDSLPDGKMEEVRKTCEQLGMEVEFAFVMDHLQEEREQNVTIDTSQTFFKTAKRRYVIIDAPGHVEFTKNMITGASQAEAAILIVDGKEGVQEQTRRHAYILGMLGLKQVIVAINKMDLAGYKQERFEDVKREIIKFLGSVSITPMYIIPISAKNGENIAKKADTMQWYGGLTILESLDTFKVSEPQVSKPLRFPVQDVYRFGDKRILAGRVESGVIKKGDKIVFAPSGKESAVTSIEVFGGSKESAEAGESIGITIAHPLFIDRGEIASSPENLPVVTGSFSANVFWMSGQPLAKSERITFKCATQEAVCMVESISKRFNSSTLELLEEDANQLLDREVGIVVLRADQPVAIENFSNIPELGRFVLVKGQDVSAGGIIKVASHSE